MQELENITNDYDSDKDISFLCEQCRKYNYISPRDFRKYHIKRGLRNEDGTGVLAGITKICNVHGYIMDEGDKVPAPGKLTYRGYSVEDIVRDCVQGERYGYEEVAWLLLMGHLPTGRQLDVFRRSLARQRELPDGFIDDIIIKVPSPNIMNTMGRSVLALYSYDENPDDYSLENVVSQSLSIIAKLPTVMMAAYQVKRRVYDRKSMYFHQNVPEFTTAQNILRLLRSDKKFTEQEARILDMCMILHAEHGGGNNSTFSTRVLTSSGTDTYAAISAGIGSLKGPRHGGANAKVSEMMEHIKAGVENWENDDEVAAFLEKIMDGKAGDGSGLIYGMGHAIYTVSDPRAAILKECAEQLAGEQDYRREMALYESVERLTPEVFARKKGISAPICANVDLYSGLVYKMLRIPEELVTPMFAASRSAGWCAHRIEEILTTGGKIIRPAYRAVSPKSAYIPLNQR